MNKLEKIFSYQGQSVRVIIKDGEPWWVSKDVCDALSIARTQIRRLDDDEKGVHLMHTPGGQQDIAIVNEYGLYSLILGSRKPEAKVFKRWITHEVLLAIRTTGEYSVIQKPTVPALAIQKPSHTNSKIREAKQLFAILRENQYVMTPEAHHAILSHVTELLTGKPLSQPMPEESIQVPIKSWKRDSKRPPANEFWRFICDLSDEIGVARPRTKDLGEWWEHALQQMDEKWLDLLSEKLDNSSNWVLQFLKKKLEQHKQNHLN
ncbi:BRO-N domain-containing protein [Aneurinibacillus terranovensis]|uniref:BRO-N domain-containing protein n=1 Tax=Aneurinibacillus terranovensis TaxID=278991 RepID=UPI00040FCA7D|nr:Bro-N domain-containing protein [Aneurinibacillus terranovensis]